VTGRGGGGSSGDGSRPSCCGHHPGPSPWLPCLLPQLRSKRLLVQLRATWDVPEVSHDPLALSVYVRVRVWSTGVWSGVRGFFFALSGYYFRGARTVCLKDERRRVRRLEKGELGLVRLPGMVVDSWCRKSPWLRIHGGRWDQATSQRCKLKKRTSMRTPMRTQASCILLTASA
jgi:hypothetical protein